MIKRNMLGVSLSLVCTTPCHAAPTQYTCKTTASYEADMRRSGVENAVAHEMGFNAWQWCLGKPKDTPLSPLVKAPTLVVYVHICEAHNCGATKTLAGVIVPEKVCEALNANSHQYDDYLQDLIRRQHISPWPNFVWSADGCSMIE